MLGQQFDRAVGQRVAIVAPAVPADVGMNVLGVKTDSFQNAQ
jgi:hypothetical protein